jgi:hypothetical protein
MTYSEDFIEIVKRTQTIIKFSAGSTDSLCTVEGKTFESKISAFNSIVSMMLSLGLDSSYLTLQIRVPDAFTSALMRDSQAQRIQDQNNISISVEEPIPNTSERVVSLTGNSEDCLAGVRQVYGLLLCRASSEAKPPAKQTFKFIVPVCLENDFTTSSFRRQLKTDFNVETKLKKVEVSHAEEFQVVRTTQWLIGTLEECKAALPTLIYKIEDSIQRGPKLTMIVTRSIGAKLSSNSVLMSQDKGLSVDFVYCPRDNDEILLEFKGSEKDKLETAFLVMEIISTQLASPKLQASRMESDGNSMTFDVTVPESLVARLIGHKGEEVRSMNDLSGSVLCFQKEVRSKQSAYDLKTPQGKKARMCTIKGTPQSISEGVRVLLHRITKMERQF